MANEFIIKNGFHSKGDSQVTGSLSITGISDVSASIAAASGGGSAFPFIGDAQITGSLTISGSFTAFKLESDNVVLGVNTGTSIQSGATANVLLGKNLGNSITTGGYNILIGDNVGGTLDTENNNIMMGYYAGGSSDGGASNVYIGTFAGRYGSGASSNVAIGYAALKGGSGNTGDYNTAIGYGAGGDMDNGNFNTLMGFQAGYSIQTGGYNTILGPYSGYLVLGGSSNIMIGHNAGNGIISGDRNIAIGYSASFSGDVSDQLIIGSGSLATISASLSTGDIIFANTASALNFSGSFQGDGSNLTGVSSTPFPFSGDAKITGSLDVSGSITTFDINMSTWTLGADGGSNYYYFTGPGDLAGTEQNPDIHLTRGQKYRFYNPMDEHPFQIQDLGGSAFSTGVTNNGVQLGFLSFDVPMDGPTHLKYQCTSHGAMVGNIYIADARVASGSFSGSFQGDGSSLTGLSAFPFTGSAQITGSLTPSHEKNLYNLD